METHLAIDRYLQGTLTESEKVDFEERLIWDKELIDEIDLAECLRDGLRASVKQNNYSLGGNVGVFRMAANWMSVPQYAAAASFVLAVALSTLVFVGSLVRVPDYGEFVVPATEIVPLLGLRGDDIQQVRFSKNITTVLLVEPVQAYDTYLITVRMVTPDENLIWELRGLRPTYPDSLAITMPPGSLTTGRYRISVAGLRQAESGVDVYESVQDIQFYATTE